MNKISEIQIIPIKPKNGVVGFYLKKEDKYYPIYKIKCSRNNIFINITTELMLKILHNFPVKVNGTFTSTCLSIATLKNLNDAHFNYPKDGNYHYSVKRQKPINGYELYITGYNEETKFKLVNKTSNEMPLTICWHENEKNIFNNLINSKNPSFEKIKKENKWTQFPSLSFSQTSDFKKTSNNALKNNNNIVINQNELIEKQLCVTGFLMAKSYNHEKFLPESNSCIFYHKTLIFDGLKILLLVKLFGKSK